MPALHCLCFSPPTSSIPTNGGINLATQSPPTLSAKPSSLHPSKPPHPASIDPVPPLPDLSSDSRQKIISLEIMGIDSGRALALNPSLSAASSDSIHSIISFLLSKGIYHKDLARILGMCPRILTSSIGADLIPVFTFLSRDLNIPDSDFRRIINKCPRLLVSSVRDQLRPAFIFLQRLGFRDVAALAYHDPVLLVSSVENTLIPKLQHLMALGLSRKEAVEMVLRCPSLFTFSVENNFKPKFEYFVKEIGGGLEELKEFPQYFAFSLEKRIRPRNQEMVGAGLSLPLSLMLKSTDKEFEELLARRGRPQLADRNVGKNHLLPRNLGSNPSCSHPRPFLPDPTKQSSQQEQFWAMAALLPPSPSSASPESNIRRTGREWRPRLQL